MSYGTEAGADAYHAARGNTTWTGATKAEALLRGSEYIDYRFRTSFPGFKALGRDQVREWPRSWAYDREGLPIAADIVPVEVEYAAYEAALRELVNPGSLLPDFSGQTRRRTKVGPIDVTYTGATGAQSVTPVVLLIEGILSPVLTARTPASGLSGRALRT